MGLLERLSIAPGFIWWTVLWQLTKLFESTELELVFGYVQNGVEAWLSTGLLQN